MVIQRYNIVCMVSEGSSGSQSSAASRAFGMSDAIQACLVEVGKIPGFWYSNGVVKKEFTGIVDSDKHRIVKESIRRWPEFTEKTYPKGRVFEGKYAGHTEHLADAMAVMVCAEARDEISKKDF